MSLNQTHHHLLKRLIEFFQQNDSGQPGNGWISKADILSQIDKEMESRTPKEQVIKSGVVCCGTCGHRVKSGYTYCNHCGQAQILINKTGGDAQ